MFWRTATSTLPGRCVESGREVSHSAVCDNGLRFRDEQVVDAARRKNANTLHGSGLEFCYCIAKVRSAIEPSTQAVVLERP